MRTGGGAAAVVAVVAAVAVAVVVVVGGEVERRNFPKTNYATAVQAASAPRPPHVRIYPNIPQARCKTSAPFACGAMSGALLQARPPDSGPGALLHGICSQGDSIPSIAGGSKLNVWGWSHARGLDIQCGNLSFSDARML